MVHWVGEGSNIIICLARDSLPMGNGRNKLTQLTQPSAVYISYDYGETFQNKTSHFKISDEPNADYAIIDKFHNHPEIFNFVSGNMFFSSTLIRQFTLSFTFILFLSASSPTRITNWFSSPRMADKLLNADQCLITRARLFSLMNPRIFSSSTKSILRRR